MKTTRTTDYWSLVTLPLLLLTGCSHLGPKTLAVDRFDYSTAPATPGNSP